MFGCKTCIQKNKKPVPVEMKYSQSQTTSFKYNPKHKENQTCLWPTWLLGCCLSLNESDDVMSKPVFLPSKYLAHSN